MSVLEYIEPSEEDYDRFFDHNYTAASRLVGLMDQDMLVRLISNMRDEDIDEKYITMVKSIILQASFRAITPKQRKVLNITLIKYLQD